MERERQGGRLKERPDGMAKVVNRNLGWPHARADREIQPQPSAFNLIFCSDRLYLWVSASSS